MELDPEDLIPRLLLADGYWATPIWDAISPHLQPGGVLVDVGAHLGYYTLKASLQVGATGCVVAIEANPETARQLESNIQASGASNVRLQICACCDADGELTLYAPPPENSGLSSLASGNVQLSDAPTLLRAIPVQGRQLDAIVRELGLSRVDVIKIDVEGAECLVLSGAGQTLARLQPVLVIEIIEENLTGMGTTVERLRQILRDAGYDEGSQIGETDWVFKPTLPLPGTPAERYPAALNSSL